MKCGSKMIQLFFKTENFGVVGSSKTAPHPLAYGCDNSSPAMQCLLSPAVATVPRFAPKGPVKPLLLLFGGGRPPGRRPGGGGRLPGGPLPGPLPGRLPQELLCKPTLAMSNPNSDLKSISRSPATLWYRAPKRHCEGSQEYGL